MISNKLLYEIALTRLPGIGCVLAKQLISYCGSAEAVFNGNPKQFGNLPALRNRLAKISSLKEPLNEAEEELKFIESDGIQVISYKDDQYPERLKQCLDSPILLYYKGKADLNALRMVGIVGTRTASEYGIEITEKIVNGLASYGVTTISGLAYGIDVTAHKASLANQVPTLGVVAHGLDRIYPYRHRNIADQMLSKGGILTEFMSGTVPDRENFPKRNRIVAGMCDALIIVESKEKGGAMITAHIANSYHREIYAVPGRLDDENSEGCHNLINKNIAAIYTSVSRFAENMGWELKTEDSVVTGFQYEDLNPYEQNIAQQLLVNKVLDLDKLLSLTGITPGNMISNLLEMELKGMIKTLPGSRYRLVR